MTSNEVTLVLFLAVTLAIAAVLLLARDLLFGKKKPAPKGAGVRQLPSLEPKASNSLIARFDHWFDRTLYLSGLQMNATAGTLLLLLCSLAAGGAAFVWSDNWLMAGLFGGLGFSGVLLFISFSKRRRVKQFLSQFPSALDLLARAVRAGESLDQAIDLVGRSTADPVSTEFKRCARQLELGLSVSATMQALTQRLGLMDVRIFGNTLSVHREAGGNLAETVERLAAVIRDRVAYHRQLKSVTSAGRFSAMFIASLGPILFAYLFVFQPQYGSSLWEDPTGRMLLIFAAVSEVIGLICVARIVKSDY